MTVSKIYGSAHTFLHIDTSFSFDDVESELDRLEDLLQTFDVSKNNVVEFSFDYSDHLPSDKSQSLENNLLDSIQDPTATIYLLDKLEKIIGKRKSSFNTAQMLEKIKVNQNQAFNYEYPFKLTSDWLGLEGTTHVTDYFDVCNENAFNFKHTITSRSTFTKNAIATFEHIQFCDVFEEKLKTIVRGDYTNYLNEFSHALNVLNQAFFHVSADETKNEDDLKVISKLSQDPRLSGRSLDCTRQGSNKPTFTFPTIEDPKITEDILCEYHLKLDFDDSGKKLADDFVRAYFGLKYNDNHKRKYIRLAYIGEHWPPRKGGKKRR